MTYEQGSTRGLVVRRSDGVIVNYRDTVRQHFVSSISTAETAARNRDKLLDNFYRYRQSAIEEGSRDPIREYILPRVGNTSAVDKLAANLATPDAKAAVAFYCATFVVNALCWNLLFGTIVRGGLLHEEVSAATIANVRRTYYVGVLVYVLATALAFVRPALGLLLNASLCVVWIRLGYRSESSVSSSPATGSHSSHKREQERLIAAAFA